MRTRREQLAWAAGLFEGEGCIKKSKDGWVCSLSSTDFDVIMKFREIVEVGHVNGPYQYEYNSSSDGKPHKPVWSWTTGKTEHIHLLFKVFEEYLGERRSAKMEEAKKELRPKISGHWSSSLVKPR